MSDYDVKDEEEGIVDQLEREVEEYKAFLFKKGMIDEFDQWLESEEAEDDIETYEKATEQESEDMDTTLL